MSQQRRCPHSPSCSLSLSRSSPSQTRGHCCPGFGTSCRTDAEHPPPALPLTPRIPGSPSPSAQAQPAHLPLHAAPATGRAWLSPKTMVWKQITKMGAGQGPRAMWHRHGTPAPRSSEARCPAPGVGRWGGGSPSSMRCFHCYKGPPCLSCHRQSVLLTLETPRRAL